MTIRVPVIVPNAGWTPKVSGNTAAKIYSPIYVTSNAGYTVIFNAAPDPTDGQQITITAFGSPAQTYTFRDTPTLTRDVQRIAGNMPAQLEALAAKIIENDSTIFDVWQDRATSDLYIKHKSSGDTFDVTISGSWVAALTSPADYLSVNGNNGAASFSGQTFTVSVDGGAFNAVILATYGDADDATTIATDITTQFIAALVAATAGSTGVPGRVYIETTNTGPTRTLEIGTSPSGFFNVGEYAVGSTTSHPASDTAGNDLTIRMFHPADPVFFRNDNRPILELADNDKRIYADFVALKEGYNINDGSTYSGGSTQTTFNAPNGYTFTGPVTFQGDIYLTGADVITQNVSILQVADRTITVNAGETQSGVDNGSGVPAGIYVDRGLWSDTNFLWYEKPAGGTADSDPNSLWTDTSSPYAGGFWQIDGPIIGTAGGGKVLLVGKPSDGGATSKVGTVVEFEQITIGDGTSTFGTFNASSGNISTALTNAIAFLASGGKIFIKRGTYTLNSTVTVNTSNITIEGEGASTNIQVDAASNRLVINTASNVLLHKLRFTSTTATTTNPMVELNSTNAARCMVEKVWFIGSGNPDVDITYDEFDGHIVANCISTTATTNLP